MFARAFALLFLAVAVSFAATVYFGQEVLVALGLILTQAKEKVAAEISDYPTPISGCDAQFNYLLAERNRIGLMLSVLGEDIFVPTPRTPTPAAGVESR